MMAKDAHSRKKLLDFLKYIGKYDTDRLFDMTSIDFI